MNVEQRTYLQALEETRLDLATARGSARARRALELVPWDLADCGSGVAGLPGQVLAMLPRLVCDVAAAPWEQISQFPDIADGPRTPLRFGTTRVGIGEDRCVDLPVIVPLLGAGHVVINPPAPAAIGTLAHTCRTEVAAIVDNLVLRALATTSPGSLLIIGDQWMPSFLDRDDVYEHRLAFDVDPAVPGHMDNVLGRIRDDIDRIQREHLAGCYASLEHLAAATGDRPEPWRLLILSALGYSLSEQQMEELRWLLRAGPACGVHAILIDTPVPANIPAETVHVSPRRIRITTVGPLLDVRPDGVPLPGSPAMVALDQRLAQGGLSAAELLPDQWWSQSSRDGLAAAVGDVGGTAELLRLGDSPPHALVGGPSGSGKTNFIYALLMGFAVRYSPDEVEFFLLDFKESVSFTSFAPRQDDPSWLPHARVIGLNINNDREFGLALLRHLSEQLRTRSDAVKRHGARDLAGLREADPAGRWPRIVAVIDEFQVLLADRDAVTEESTALLEDLARRGRSFGIHLVLSSQDVSGIEALWGRPALVAQLTLRVAMPKAARVLAQDNNAAEFIPPFHAVVNHDSGASTGNRTVRIPHFDDEFLSDVQARLWKHRDPTAAEPTVFDGERTPRLDDAGDYQALRPAPAGQRVMLLGRTFDVADRAASAVLSAAPGRNLAIIGTRIPEVTGVLGAATLSIAQQCTPGQARFTVLTGGSDTEPGIAAELDDLLTARGYQSRLVERGQILAFLRQLAAECEEILHGARPPGPRHYISFVGVDAANAVLRRSPAEGYPTGHELLRQIVSDAPETGIHLLGWWRSAHRLREDLSDFGSHLDDQLGVWVALDAHGDELVGLPGADFITWHPRPRRALWFDRATHKHPQLLVPYAPIHCGETP